MANKTYYDANLKLGPNGRLYFTTREGAVRPLTTKEIDPSVEDGIDLSEITDEVAAALGFSFSEVATNNDKLSLTGISDGTLVKVTGEADRLEQYIGDGGDDLAGFYLGPSGSLPSGLLFFPSGEQNGVTRYAASNGATVLYSDVNQEWVVYYGGPRYRSTSSADYPWEVTEWVVYGFGTAPAPSVTERRPEAGVKNWRVLGADSVQLLFNRASALGGSGSGGGSAATYSVAVDGGTFVSIPPGTTTDLGFIRTDSVLAVRRDGFSMFLGTSSGLFLDSITPKFYDTAFNNVRTATSQVLTNVTTSSVQGNPLLMSQFEGLSKVTIADINQT
jgi:hypothetical protein